MLTSAVRDAANGAEFLARVRAQRYGLDARVIAGDEEARLTFLGATSERAAGDATPTLVIDIGGGSTELVVGSARRGATSTSRPRPASCARPSATWPPTRRPPPSCARLADDVRETYAEAVPRDVRRTARTAIAVAGTATSLGAIDLDLEHYSPERVHGHVVPVTACRRILARLAALPEEQRREVRGLHPDRAPTIVAGVVMIIEALRALRPRFHRGFRP